MCVIIYKPKFKSLNDIKDLKNAFNYNSDGAGFMFNDGKNVHIKKGFMTYKALKNALKSVPQNCDVIIHCRIGTSGKNSPQNTHPYPLYTSIQDMKKLNNVCNFGLAHNGVLSDYNPNKINRYDLNDTQLFILRFINLINKNKLFSPTTKKVLELNSLNNRLAIMSKNKVILTGNWKEKNGIYYSNLNHDINYYDLKWYNSYYNDDDYCSSLDALYDEKMIEYNCDCDCFNCKHYNCELNESYQAFQEIKGGY